MQFQISHYKPCLFKFLSYLQTSYKSWITVQYRKWSPTANDPETANDSQNGLQMILDRKWSPKLTANDPEIKIGMNGLDSS